jgi:hypothetical protein
MTRTLKVTNVIVLRVVPLSWLDQKRLNEAPLQLWIAEIDAWVTRLLNCHSGRLITTWTTLMKAGRHKADSYEKYRVYFNLADPKMAQYELLPENTYNMDEKGLAIGVTGRSKRIFDKVLYGKKQFRQSLHDGNREWVTLASARMGQLFHQASSIQLLEEPYNRAGLSQSHQKSTLCTSLHQLMAGQITSLVQRGLKRSSIATPSPRHKGDGSC